MSGSSPDLSCKPRPPEPCFHVFPPGPLQSRRSWDGTKVFSPDSAFRVLVGAKLSPWKDPAAGRLGKRPSYLSRSAGTGRRMFQNHSFPYLRSGKGRLIHPQQQPPEGQRAFHCRCPPACRAAALSQPLVTAGIHTDTLGHGHTQCARGHCPVPVSRSKSADHQATSSEPDILSPKANQWFHSSIQKAAQTASVKAQSYLLCAHI